MMNWRRVCLVATIAVALVAPGCVLGKSHKRQHPKPASARWNPLSKQTADAATTFLFDPAVARTQAPGNGGFIMGDARSGDVPWQSTSKVVVVPGRYRQGVQSTSASGGYLWMPSTGILSPSAFTIEFWAKGNVPLSAIGGQTPVTVSGVSFNFSRGIVQAIVANNATYPPVTATLAANVASVQANTWTNFALTYAHGQLILYVNGRVAASKTGVRRAAGVVGHEPRRGPYDRRQRTRCAGVRYLGSSDQPRGPGSGKAPRNRRIEPEGHHRDHRKSRSPDAARGAAHADHSCD